MYCGSSFSLRGYMWTQFGQWGQSYSQSFSQLPASMQATIRGSYSLSVQFGLK